MRGYGNFDKLPENKVMGKAFKGYEELRKIIKQYDSDTVIIDCYPEVDSETLAEKIKDLFDIVVYSDECALKGEALENEMSSDITDDRIFGVMTSKKLEDFFIESKINSARKMLTSKGKKLIIGVGATLIASDGLILYASITRWEIQLRFRKGLNNWNAYNHSEDPLTKFKRGYFCEWRIADKHREKIFPIIDYFINTNGAPRDLCYKDVVLIENNEKPIIDYVSVSHEEYSFWLKHYQRDLYKNFTWAIPDFGRPKLKKVKYDKGRFGYKVKGVSEDKEGVTFALQCDKTAFETLGMPFESEITYTFKENTIFMDLKWFDKKANRLPEEIWMHLPFMTDYESIEYKKLGTYVSPYRIVRNGGRNLSVVEEVKFRRGDFVVRTECGQCAPVSLGEGKLLKFDNKTGDGRDGFSYLLYNNIWGTNYPLWYRDNAAFEWKISVENK